MKTAHKWWMGVGIVLGFLVIVAIVLVVLVNCLGGNDRHKWKDLVQARRIEDGEEELQSRSTSPTGKGKRSPLVVSCTTIPSGWKSLRRTLKSVLALKPAPTEIFVNIPATCRRTGEAYVVPAWLRDGPFTLLPDVEDTGPSTKYLPTLRHLANTGRGDTPVFVMDDDAVLRSHTLERLTEIAKEYPDDALTFGGKRLSTNSSERFEFKKLHAVYAQRTWRYAFQKHGCSQKRTFLKKSESEPVDLIMGHSTYIVRPRFFDLERLSDYSAFPPEARFVDDVVISGCLAERGVQRLVVNDWPEPRKQVQVVWSDTLDEMFKRRSSSALHNTVNRASHNDDMMLNFFADAW